MKVFSVFGTTKTGKTTTIENILRELGKRRYSAGSVKEIHNEEFAIDKPGTNTHRHKEAGSQLVTARGYCETDLLFQRKLTVDEILRFYDHDFVIMEGVTDTNAPKIITANAEDEIMERLDGTIFAISGRIAGKIQEFKGLPVIDATTDVEKLVDLIEKKVYERLPEFPPQCCMACGSSCRELAVRILKGEASRKDCIISNESLKLYIDGREIPMVPFVQKVLFNAVYGVVKELEGYRKDGSIVVKVPGLSDIIV